MEHTQMLMTLMQIDMTGIAESAPELIRPVIYVGILVYLGQKLMPLGLLAKEMLDKRILLEAEKSAVEQARNMSAQTGLEMVRIVKDMQSHVRETQESQAKSVGDNLKLATALRDMQTSAKHGFPFGVDGALGKIQEGQATQRPGSLVPDATDSI